MWSRKRVLRKERKHYAKKRILLVSLLCALASVVLFGIGVFVLSREPAFLSPIPFLRSIGIGNDDKTKEVIERFLKEENMSYSAIVQVSKTTYQISDTPEKTIYISTEKDVLKQMSSLQRIVSRLTMEGKKYSRLDMRYNKPVIVLQ